MLGLSIGSLIVVGEGTSSLSNGNVGKGFSTETPKLDIGSHPFNVSHRDKNTRLLADRAEIYLYISKGDGYPRSTKFFFIDNENVTTGWNNGYDSTVGLNSKDFLIYSKVIGDENQHRELGINSLPPQMNTDYEISLGVHAKSGQALTFYASNIKLPQGLNVVLEDREKSVFTSLYARENYYQVEATEDLSGTGRFYLHTRFDEQITEEITSNAWFFYDDTYENTGNHPFKGSVANSLKNRKRFGQITGDVSYTRLHISRGEELTGSKINFLPTIDIEFYQDVPFVETILSSRNYDLRSANKELPFTIWANPLLGETEKAVKTIQTAYDNLEDLEVPVLINAKAGTELTFYLDWSETPDNVNYYLEDRQVGVFTKLNNVNSKYTLTISENMREDSRFYIRTTTENM